MMFNIPPRRFSAFVALALIFPLAPAEAQTPSSPQASAAPETRSNLPADIDIGGAFVPDFSYAGYAYGAEDIPNFDAATQIDVVDYGVVANDEKDDSDALLRAMDAANAVRGPVILALPSGRIILSEIIPITRSHIVLRGAGEAETDVHIPRPLSMIDTKGKFSEIHDYLTQYKKIQRDADRNIDTQFSDYSWTGGFLWIGPKDYRAAAYLEALDKPDLVFTDATSGERGARTLSVTSPSSLSLGDDIELVWYSRDGESGGIIKSLYGETDLKVGSHHWSFPDRGLVRQKTQITAIEGDRITLADPLLHPVSPEIPASLVDWSPLHHVGIEDLTISFSPGVSFGHHLEQGYNAVYFAGAMHSWVRDVTFKDADSGILSYGSANLTFDNITTIGARTAHYSIHAGNVHNVLVSDLSVQNRVRHPLSVNTQSTKTVFLRSEVFVQPTFDQHAGSNHQNLFDQTIFHIDAHATGSGPRYPVWDGSGAGYWQPGHGRFNTTYNLEIRVKSGATRNQPVVAEGLAEGPDARIIGVWGNRPLSVNYQPEPVTALIGSAPEEPSLYQWQLKNRMTLLRMEPNPSE